MSQSAEVYFNGKKVAEFSDGFDNEIVLDDSDLRYGDWNFITVKLDDEGGRWNWRGIKSDVFLEVKPKTKIMFPAVRTFVKYLKPQLKTILAEAKSLPSAPQWKAKTRRQT